MTQTVGDFLLQRLSQWGVKRIYGYPGDGINGIMGALGRNKEMEFIQARHEELAAFMACAHAKFSGEIGVCLATSGPGAIHLLNGLYDAKMDHQPVLAIVGQQKRAGLGGDYQQEVDLLSLFKDVASEYVHMATTPAQVRHLVDRAVRIALEHRTVTCLIFPNDIQDMKAVPTPPREHGTVHSGIGRSGHAIVPPENELRAAADILNAGKRVAILAGAGALHATDELIETADLLGAGIAKALLGKAAVPDDLPYVTGSIGLLGTEPSWEMMTGCDTLLMVGSAFPYSEFLPPEGQARGVQIDIDGRMLSLRYPMEMNLVGDAKATLAALLPLLQKKSDRGWRQTIEKNVEHWWRVLENRAIAFAIVAGGRDDPGARLPGGTPGAPVGGLPVGFPVLNARLGSPGIPGTCRAAGTELNLISCLGAATTAGAGVARRSRRLALRLATVAVDQLSCCASRSPDFRPFCGR